MLAEIYNSSNDVNVKRAILRRSKAARDKDRLLQIAKTEKQPGTAPSRHPHARLHPGNAGRHLGAVPAEPSVEGKQQILETMPSAGNLDKLLEVARSEKDTKLRRFAIQNLALPRAASTGDTLARHVRRPSRTRR